MQQWTGLKGHHFWPLLEADGPAIYTRALGHQQVYDAWLVTLDTRLPVHSLKTGVVEVIKT